MRYQYYVIILIIHTLIILSLRFELNNKRNKQPFLIIVKKKIMFCKRIYKSRYIASVIVVEKRKRNVLNIAVVMVTLSNVYLVPTYVDY